MNHSFKNNIQQLWINEDIGNYPYETANVNFTVPADGIYYLSFRVFSDPDIFYLSLDNIKVFETDLATENIRQSTLKFHPNPVKEIVTISDTKVISAVEIFDLSGKKVFVSDEKSTQLKLNLSALKSGVYIAKVKSNGEEKTFKLIKK